MNEISELARWGELDLVDASKARALAVAASARGAEHPPRLRECVSDVRAFLRARYGEACVQTFTVAAVATWRDQLQEQGLAPSSVRAARERRSPARRDDRCRPTRAARALQPGPARASQDLSDRELSALLARPDLRTTIGTRDRAILELLARAAFGARPPALTDVQERDRQPEASCDRLAQR